MHKLHLCSRTPNNKGGALVWMCYLLSAQPGSLQCGGYSLWGYSLGGFSLWGYSLGGYILGATV